MYPLFDASRFRSDYIPHVALELMTSDHAPELAQIAAEDDIWRNPYTHIPKPDAVPAFIDAALRDAAKGGTRPFVIRWLNSPEALDNTNVVGCTRFFHLSPLHRRVQIGGTWLTTGARRTGVNRAVKWLLLREAFEVMRMQRVEFAVHPENSPSRKAMLSLGAAFEGVLRKYLYLDGKPRDAAMYSIVDDDWNKVNLKIKGLPS